MSVLHVSHFYLIFTRCCRLRFHPDHRLASVLYRGSVLHPLPVVLVPYCSSIIICLFTEVSSCAPYWSGSALTAGINHLPGQSTLLGSWKIVYPSKLHNISINQNVYSAPSRYLLRGAPDPGQAEKNSL